MKFCKFKMPELMLSPYKISLSKESLGCSSVCSKTNISWMMYNIDLQLSKRMKGISKASNNV